MTQICPKCSYIRKDSDTCPDWQCPSCQVAYCKAGDTVDRSASFRRATISSMPSISERRQTIPWRWLPIIVLIAIIAWHKRPHHRSPAGPTTTSTVVAKQGQPTVILYGTSWCGYCAAARDLFNANGIAFTELDVEKTTEGYEGHKKLGGRGVPLIVVGDNVMRGYNEEELRQSLSPWMHQGS